MCALAIYSKDIDPVCKSTKSASAYLKSVSGFLKIDFKETKEI